ncbi:MAG: hypothetical protein H7Y38_14200 [Armatimonadetes bacterium]|nr:hypothetical protein [Armatimonadota bacterium]
MQTATERAYTLTIPADLYLRLARVAEGGGQGTDQFALNALSASVSVAEPVGDTRPSLAQDQRKWLAHARALISKWQTADNTPTAAPAPNDGTTSPSEALFRQWEREDELLTDEDREAQARLWEQFQQGINAERAASGTRLIF